MRSVLLLRHAKSSWKHPDLSDHDRALNKRGKSDAQCMGRLLKKENFIPDIIISSTAIRARATAETGILQLKAIDDVWRELPKKERDNTIEALIGDQEIRRLLFRRVR